ncbi:MAG TPA: HEPN domain-containing protein [Chloroflexota bacterium]|nr:HEPN domain-containing protein [Chloroflexota bacterium]
MERSADWLNQAQGDLAHAKNDLADGFYDWSCFSAQQAAEKAVKAVLYRKSGEAWGHSVADLLGALGAGMPVPPDLVDVGLELDKVYIAARYPDAHPSGAPRNRYTRTEAQRLVAYAERIIQFCESHLSTP